MATLNGATALGLGDVTGLLGVGKLVYDVERIVRDAKASSLRIRTAAGGPLTPPECCR